MKLVLSGVTVPISLRKNTDGVLGIGFGQSHATRTQGVVIADVVPRSAAHVAGLRSGDVLVSVDGHLVDDPQAAVARLSEAPRAVSCVAWRPRPDATEPATPTPTPAPLPPTPRGAEAERSDGAAEAAEAVSDGANGQLDAMSWGVVPPAYYAHDLMAEGGTPPGVLPYEDLTIVHETS